MKLKKQPADNTQYYIDFTKTFNVSSDTLLSATAIVSSPTGITITNQVINTGIINGTILPGKAVQFMAASGVDGYEYILTCVGTSVLGQVITVEAVLIVVNSIELPIDYYGNILRANTYLNLRVDSSAWVGSDNPTQRKALYKASSMIDRLNFKGSKADSNQILEFPRQGQVLNPIPDPYSLDPTINMQVYVAVIDTDVPLNIEYASYELAYQLLDGVSLDEEIRNLTVLSQGYSSVRSTYDRTRTPVHVINGIPSIEAWNYLLPYLRDGRSVTLSRVN